MTTSITQAVTVQQTRGDVLSPAEYRSLVTAIRATISDRGFAELNAQYRSLLKHLADFTNPHQDHSEGFYDEIVAKSYEIYKIMTPSPLTFDQYRETIVPSLDYLELFLGILENDQFYNSARSPMGRISRTVQLDRNPLDRSNTSTSINFDQSFQDRSAFIKGGWQHATRYKVVRTAEDLTPTFTQLPLIAAPDRAGECLLDTTSHSLTFSVTWKGLPETSSTLFSFNNTKTISVKLNPDQSVSIYEDDDVILTTDPIAHKTMDFQMSPAGHLSIITPTDQYTILITYQTLAGLSSVNIVAPFPLFKGSAVWCLLGFLVYQGAQYIYPLFDTATNEYTAALYDPDGEVMVEDDGALIIDYDVDVPEGFYLLVDLDGVPFVDAEGDFLLVFGTDDNAIIIPYLPYGFAFVTDKDDKLVLTSTGKFIIKKL